MSSESEIDGEPSGEIADYLDDGQLTYDGWRRALEDDRLLGQACADCGHETAAPKAACARCGSDSLVARELPRSGEVFSETTIAVAPAAFDGPYQVALVDLQHESEPSGQLLVHVDGDVGIGDTVELIGTVEAEDEPAPVFGPA